MDSWTPKGFLWKSLFILGMIDVHLQYKYFERIILKKKVYYG